VSREADDVVAALATFDFGHEREFCMVAENVAMLTFMTDLQVLIAIQPVEADRTALHMVGRGIAAKDGQKAWAKKLERLRAEIEHA
jgi:hypothetical protein